MLKRFVTIFGGDPNKREIEKFSGLVEQINGWEKDFESLSDEALLTKTAEFKQRYQQDENLDDLLPEAFAAVREASKRTLGLRHYDVQLIGGITLHQGKIAEMRTGEGKTLVATLPMYLNAIRGEGVHLVTVNDYLARRDARWMAPIFHSLGLKVGVLQMAARTENGKKAFLVDLERESPHEDQHQLRMIPRVEAYAADIVYGTNSEFGFDYLRDNMAWRLEDRVQRGHYYAIVDEVDNILIDEARTPLIISGPASEDVEWYTRMAQVVRSLRSEDVEVNERDKNVTLTEIGETHVEDLLGIALRDPERPEDVTPEQARLLGYLEQALRAQFLFHRNKDYLVQAGKIVIVDEFTGRLMPGRRWSDGLHQAVEAKENTRVQPENVTYATITIQNYFRMYEKLAGMSGTAITEAEEFDKIYKLGVVAIPTNLEYHAVQSESGLVELEDKDAQGYKYRFYASRDDPVQSPVFWKRKDYPDVIYRSQEAKLRAIMQEILHDHVRGRPILVGTTSVELSERVSNRMRAEPLRRLAQVLILRTTWFEQNKREEDGRQVPDLMFLNDWIDQLDVTHMRKLSRDLNMPFSPEEDSNLERLRQILELDPADIQRLSAALQGGIPHQVLNARKHTEESQIIANAGAFGAVTIATNMAGRGVDIKLGGELPENVLSTVNRVLRRAGHKNPYDMSLEERQEALLKLEQADYGIYEADVRNYLKYIEDMEKVRALGGLHVIGSERHEARRIDNQLRGRSARQGDPGSSRFYLSMEDDLMRLFGGEQANNLMQRLKMDDALPLEVNLVSRLVEQSQTRVEGANFDMRKHLLEYDDVLNSQRASIYKQRDRIFTKDDLSEDVSEMLRTEVNQRVPEALSEDGGPWRLLAWLDQIQPPLVINSQIFPSYSLRLLVEEVWEKNAQTQAGMTGVPIQQAQQAMLEVARNSLLAEEEHVLQAIRSLLDQTRQRYDGQLSERLESLDAFFQTAGEVEEGEEPRSPRQMVDELSALVRLPLKLTPDQQRLLRDDPQEVQEEIHQQVDSALFSQAVLRVLGAVNRRLEDEMVINTAQLSSGDWDDLEMQVMASSQASLDKRRERLVGSGTPGSESQIQHDLETALENVNGLLNKLGLLHLLLVMPQGARTVFDRKTHKRVQLRTQRLTYAYYAARFLEDRSSEAITEDVLNHLQEAQQGILLSLGVTEWNNLGAYPIESLDQTVQNRLKDVLGEEPFEKISKQALHTIPEEFRQPIIEEFGRRALTGTYRQLLLGVISELWVDYLTQMEALRISIGLEAYAQRDPLVQYKAKASQLFQELLSNMRMGVISHMFTYKPREIGHVEAVEKEELPETPEEIPGGDGAKPVEQAAKRVEKVSNGDGKKHRRRHRR